MARVVAYAKQVLMHGLAYILARSCIHTQMQSLDKAQTLPAQSIECTHGRRHIQQQSHASSIQEVCQWVL